MPYYRMGDDMNYADEIASIIYRLGPGQEHIARFLYVVLLELLSMEGAETTDAA